jgi:hypothetical protein
MTNARTGRDHGPGRHARPRSNWVERTSRYSAVQLSEIETMFVALRVGRLAVLLAWLDADALGDDGLPIVDGEDGLDSDGEDGLEGLDGDASPIDELAPPAGAASTVPVTVTL